MAICPFAEKKLIRPGSSDPAIKVVGAILHVDAGNAASLFEYFRDRSGGIESHFHIRKDGVIEQYRDTGFEADANLKANSFIAGGERRGYVSIETQGFGAGTWTILQMAAIEKLLLWLSETHDFPLTKASSPFAGGVGFHTLFGAPSAWTPVAKSCPGPDRIKQFYSAIVPWMAEVTRGVEVRHRVATWNVEHRRSPKRVLREVTRLSRDHDVLLLQEAQEYRTILKQVPDFRVKGKGENLILVRNGLKVRDTRVAQVTSTGWFTRLGRRTAPEFVTYTTVDGIEYSSWHWPPSIQSKAQRLATPRRWGSAREMGDNFTLANVAIAGGDFNVHAPSDKGRVKGHPLSVFKRAGAQRRYAGKPTHKTREIDYFATRGVEMRGLRVLGGFGGDHKPVSATATARFRKA